MRRYATIVTLVFVMGAMAIPAFAQCTSCGTGVCPALPYAGPTACFPPPVPACPTGTVTFINQTTFNWSGPATCSAAFYDVAVGDLACLKGNCSLDLSCPGCMLLENNDVDLMAVDASVLPVGQGVWYLVRMDAESWNTTGAGQCSDYDAALGPPLICTP